MTRSLLALLIYASLASAQPWQWELYQSTFWHQAPNLPQVDIGSPMISNLRFVVGDFNGNGRDEFLNVWDAVGSFVETDTTTNVLDWHYSERFQPFPQNNETILFAQATDIDDDIDDELLIYSVLETDPFTPYARSYDPNSLTPPLFTERPDFLEALAYPGWPSPSMLGDLDGDSLLDGFTPTENGWQHYERNGNAWTLIETLQINTMTEYAYYIAADINSDGNMEFGVYEPGIDCNCLFGTIIDYADGQTNVVQMYDEPLLYPGDYDGDGNTESFMDNFDLSLPSRIVRLSAGNPYSYTELVNQWEANSPVVYSINSNGENRLYGFLNGTRFQIGTWDIVPAGYTMEWSDSTWSLAGDGSWFGNVYEGNTADMDGDGDKEYIYRMLSADWFGPDRVVWSMGSGNLERFFDNPDTLFTNPRIGDVEADGAGELVTRVASGAPVGLYFFELERNGNEVIAHHKPYLSDGLPTNMTEFTLADIDNDGHAELFINTGFWRSFFWRNGHWEEYANILPTGIGLNLYFADFEGDGDLDVFSQNGVWISLSPSAADDPVVAPSSFMLSSYPNPFNAQTTITFDLPRAGEVSLKLFDVLGREVETLLSEKMIAGTHTLNYSASALPSGVYFIRFMSNEINATHKLLLLK